MVVYIRNLFFLKKDKDDEKGDERRESRRGGGVWARVGVQEGEVGRGRREIGRLYG